MKRDLRIARTYAHPPALVWRALTERELIGEWLMENDFVAEVGARFTLRTDPQPGFDGIVRCEVLAMQPPDSMRWSWRGGPIDTEVTFTLEPVLVFSEVWTKLTVEQTGFRGFDAVLVSFILQRGNASIYGRVLPALLAELATGRPTAGHRARAQAETGAWWFLARVFAPVLGRRRAATRRHDDRR